MDLRFRYFTGLDSVIVARVNSTIFVTVSSRKHVRIV